MKALRPRWRKVLSDLWGNKARSALVISSIAVGLFAVGMISALNVMLKHDLQTGYAAVNPANIQIISSVFTASGTSQEDLEERIQKVSGVDEVEGRYLANLRVRSTSGEWLSIELHAVKSFEEMNIDRLRLIDGRMPREKHEIILDRAKWGDLNTQVGNEIEIELPSGQTRRLRLVGLVQDQMIGSTGGGGFFMAPIQGYITLENLTKLGYPYAYNRLYVTVSGDINDLMHIAEVADRVRHEIEDNGQEVYSIFQRRGVDHPNTVYLDAMGGILVLLGLLVVFLSGFLITNTITALLNQQMEQIGILKTFGGRRYQIMVLYLLLLLAFGGLAFVIGLVSAQEAAFRMLNSLAAPINFVSYGRRFIPAVVGLQLALALLTPQLAGFIPIMQGSRRTVQEALSGIVQEHRSNHPVGRRRSYREERRHKNAWLRKFSRPLLLSLRNTFRRKGRLGVTLITLSLGGALFIATFNTRAALEDYIERLSKNFLADVSLTLEHPYRMEEIKLALANSPEISYVEGWAQARSEIIEQDGKVGESVYLQAPPAGSELVQPIIMEGRWLLPEDQNAVVLSDLFRVNYPTLKIGDTIRLRINGKETDWVVVGFFQLAGRGGGYLAYMNFDYLAPLIGQPGQAMIYKVMARHSGLTLDEQKALGQKLENLLEEAGYKTSGVSAGLSLKNSTAEGLDILTAFLLIMAGLTALVGGIGMMGTMSLNVLERTREIGVMRAIGATDRILFKLVLVEGLLIGFLSWVIASLLAIPISNLMSDIVSRALFGSPTDLAYTPFGFFAWLGVVLGLAAVASAIPAGSATRMTIREVLAYE